MGGLFEDDDIITEGGKYINWNDLVMNKSFVMGAKYFAHDKSRTLRFIIYVQNLVINGNDTLLLFISEPSLEEQSYARLTENKYSQLLISTITHDLKSPLMVLQENTSLLSDHIDKDGINYLNILQTELQFFEYYIYDLVVILNYDA